MRKLPLLFMVLLTFFSCREPDCPEGSEEQARLPESFTNFFNFKKGSYWILQNEINGRLDSIWMYRESIFKTAGTFYGNNQGIQCPLTTRFFGSFASLDTTKQRFDEIYLEMLGNRVDNSLIFWCGSSLLNTKNDSIIIDAQDKLSREILWKQDKVTYDDGKYDKNFLKKNTYINFTYNQIISDKKYGRIFQVTPLALYDTLFFAEKVGIVKAYRLDTAYQLIRYHLN